MRRLAAAGLLPERAGQPVRAWAHISLADLMLLDGDSALQQEWTEQVRARWAARRAYAAEAGASDGAWLDGDAAAAIACDAAMAPVVTGDVNVDALEDLVRLCVELGSLRQDGDPRPGPTAARAALEQAVIGKAVDLLSGPGGLASFLMGTWQATARLHRGVGALSEDRGVCLPDSCLRRSWHGGCPGADRQDLAGAAGAGDPFAASGT